MKKYFVTIIISLLIGFLLANFMLRQYDSTVKVIPTFKQNETIYLVQQGVYSSLESMKDNTKKLNYYVYTMKDGFYYVYVGMSLDSEIIKKIQNYYTDLKTETIIKTITSANNDFTNTLKQTDEILKETDDKDTIKEVINQILKKYEGS